MSKSSVMLITGAIYLAPHMPAWAAIVSTVILAVGAVVHQRKEEAVDGDAQK